MRRHVNELFDCFLSFIMDMRVPNLGTGNIQMFSFFLFLCPAFKRDANWTPEHRQKIERTIECGGAKGVAFPKIRKDEK